MKVRTHRLKTYPEYFEAVLLGLKTFEVRRDDRGFNRGDGVDLLLYGKDRHGRWNYLDGLEWRNSVPEGEAQLLSFTIGWVLTGGQFGLEPGYVAFSLTPNNGGSDER